ncbi:hypothetical protein RN001_015288 [Aquatica leii]|uniref:Uncharacterized protein n=1 Tax=Aquatica leii TaxID=1421715 RepID=A0AAN7PPG6_9COLE|nr:hypothetical protein RN001_015288 [Aquatica leii]
MFKVIVLCAIVAVARATFLEPTFKIETPVHALRYEVQPAVTKTEFIPGSYSSSYRSDVITPRLKFTETPGLSLTVAQPTIAVAPSVARVEHVAPVLAKTEFLASPSIHTVARGTLLGHGLSYAEPLPIARSFSVAHHL